MQSFISFPPENIADYKTINGNLTDILFNLSHT